MAKKTAKKAARKVTQQRHPITPATTTQPIVQPARAGAIDGDGPEMM